MKHLTLGRAAQRVMALEAPVGGVDISSPPHRIRDDRLSDALNLRQRDGLLTTRPAVREYGSLPAAAGMTYTVSPLGNYTFLHGQVGNRHLIALIDDDGTPHGQLHTMADVRGLFAVSAGRDPETDDGREAIVFVDSTNSAVRGVYGLSADGVLTKVEPYAPTILSAARPTVLFSREDSGAYMEGFNRLTDTFRCSYTADGEGLYYWLPEGVRTDMTQPFTVSYIDMTGGTLTHTVTVQGEDGVWHEEFATLDDIPVDRLALYCDASRGCFWFKYANGSGPAPVIATVANNVTVTASRQATDGRSLICGMRFGTWFGGSTDGTVGGTRLFLSGNSDRPNLVQWSALSDPLYFPEHNYAYVGNAADAVTAFGKQSDMLVIFKEHEVYATQYRAGSTVTAEQLLSGAVVDAEASAAVFPMQQIHPEIGCDCPHTVRLCGDRLVWLCTDGRVYALYSSGAYDVRSVRAVSRPIEAALGTCTKAQLSTATAACHDELYLLWLDGTAYALDYASGGFAHYSSYATDTAAQAAIAWQIWSIPLTGLIAGVYGRACFVAASGDTVVTHTLTEVSCDRVAGVEHPIVSRLYTKWFELGAPEQYKHIGTLRLWITGDDGERVTVSLCDGSRRDIALLRLDGRDITATPPRSVPVSAARVRYAGIALACTGRMTLDRLEMTYRRMGEMRE